MANMNWAWQPPKGTTLPKSPRSTPDTAIPGPRTNARTSVPYSAPKTEQVEPGGHARGTGANVSDVLRGYNNAQDKMFQAIGGRVNAHYKARRKARLARRRARKQAG